MRYKIACIIFLVIMITTSCGEADTFYRVDWKTATSLSSKDGKLALGVAGPVGGVSNNYLLVAGGANFPEAYPWEGGKKKYCNTAFVFRKDKDTLVLVSDDQALPDTIAYAAVAQAGNSIVYAGGETAAGISDRVYRLSISEGIISIDSLPSLPLALTNATMSFWQNRLYFVGGETLQLTSKRGWCLDLQEPGKGWVELPGLSHPVSHCVSMILNENGKDLLYLFGGRCKNPDGISTRYKEVIAFDLVEGKWVNKKPLPHFLAAGTGVCFNNTAWLFGGDEGIVFNKLETLIAKAAGLKGDEKEAVIAEKNKIQRSHGGFSATVLSFNPNNQQWDSAGVIPFTVPVTTVAFLSGSSVYIPTGESKPGVRTPQILQGTFEAHKH